MSSDTIFAEATAQGRAGVSIVRISGPKAREAGEGLAGALPEHGRALRRLVDASGALIDEALVLTFAGGRSFTGEPVVELQCHGSLAVVRALLDRLAAMPGLRLAEPGEFTRRALVAGRLDLVQVEALADLIDAETEIQRRQAMEVMSGQLGRAVETWRGLAVRAMALVEATLDFSEDEIPDGLMDEVGAMIADLSSRIESAHRNGQGAERVRRGFEVAIVGPPNAGKSTLLNRLAGRQAALTSEIAGTTRDVIEVRLDLGGLPVTVLDTAGLREDADGVEAAGIDFGRQRAAAADIRVYLGDAEDAGPDDLVLVPKDDDGLAGGISGRTGAGVDSLIGQVVDRLRTRVPTGAYAIRDRHRLAMEAAMGYLAGAEDGILAGASPELIAEDLRLAIRALSSILGHVDVEDLLGDIFASFCIGK
ncbi:tRNA uridine-5-carboxymethylaminomethyl(34) synthesis GTPase MnmE [Wenxinia saemankumensis]|uniref:tRNA modification GTPase MnmE n=1 Tax=Wenxinia saemankumensis TaxID=1447782 RepID=A0A1M6G1Z4_9RHOB|nr:tRNA uridine-5-carboxymethylaminomethyl(34) synthesis GTPase MnmE [Wenxinia saemankumensis]SHJ03953.1 tRNA modification GTPase trmE [Wenxinia saemankumensis]